VNHPIIPRAFYVSKKAVLVFLRLVTLALKLVITLSIAKKFGAHDLGVYSIFMAILLTSVFIVGFEFYSYFNREVIKRFSEEEIYIYLNLHFIAIVGGVLFWLLPIYYTLKIFLSTDIIWIYLFIIFAEYFNTEIYRYLISFKMPIHASFNLLLRNGMLGAILVITFLIDLNLKFKELFFIWAVLELLGIISGLYFIFKKLRKKKYKLALNFKKFHDVFRTVIPMYLASFCIKGVENIDKFIIDFFLGKDMLGIYSLYYSIASVVQIICYSAVIMEDFPKLVEQKCACNFELKIKKLRKNLIAWSMSISLILVAAIYPVLIYLNNHGYNEYIGIFFFMLITNIIISTGWSFHYKLYIGGNESMVLKSSLLQFLIHSLLLMVLVPNFGLSGAVVSVLIAAIIGYYTKKYFVKITDFNQTKAI
jgi:O-antigen/teichoic acid export membrane protein